MTRTAVNEGGNADAANAAGAGTHRQNDGDVDARLTGVKALLDQSAGTLKTLHAAVVLSGGRMPAQAELDLAAEARETLAAVARALPPRALLGGGGFKGDGGGAVGNEGGGRAENGSSDRLTRLATVEKTVQNLGMLPPPVPVPVGAAAAAAATAAGAAAAATAAGAAAASAPPPRLSPPPPPPRHQ